MKGKNIIFFCLSCLALVATITGVCCFFFVNRPLKNVPSLLYVQSLQGQNTLVCSYGGDCSYVFKLEQKVSDNLYIVVQEVETKVNTLNLSSTKLGVVAGQEYRFSVKYKNGVNESEFCKAIPWLGVQKLNAVDLESATFYDGVLNWKDVANADFYDVKIVLPDATVLSYNNLQDSQIPLAGKFVGKAKVYVLAKSDNKNFLTSDLSVAKELEV